MARENKKVNGIDKDDPSVGFWKNRSLKTLPGEKWIVIPNCDRMYEGSNFGRIKSYYKGGRILVQCMGTGYLIVGIYKNGVPLTRTVHTIIAGLFLDKKNKKRTVNHKDGNKYNNASSNLEYNTIKENIIHAHLSGLANIRGINNAKAKLTEKQVLEIYSSSLSSEELAKKYKVAHTTIRNIKRGRFWSHVTKKGLNTKTV